VRPCVLFLKYGVPAAAGLATGGYALSQGEDPGSAALAAGLGATWWPCRITWFSYCWQVFTSIGFSFTRKVVIPAGNVVGDIGRNIPTESKIRAGAIGATADVINQLENINLGSKGSKGM